MLLLASAGAALGPPPLGAQQPDGVLVRAWDSGPDGPLQVDRGAAGVWQRLQKVGTTASVLYTAGHPDDEEAGVLTLLSRGMGVRTALLTLNRGEGGANAIGPELFDALGLIRTEELRLAGRYYGLDDQYFTTAVDYGFSKTLDEAMRSWSREAVLEDMVRVIRTNRPLVVISRWHGSARDGHGHHQAAGVLTPEAVVAAADPSRFPEQLTREGLRPWRVRATYRGRLLASEAHDVELDPWIPSPWLGASYQAYGAYGLSLQRSQTSGRLRDTRGGGPPARYERLALDGEGPAGVVGASRRSPRGGMARDSAGLFLGLDLTLPGVGDLLGEPLPESTREALATAQAGIDRARASFDFRAPEAVVPDLVAALGALRTARADIDPAGDVAFHLAVEERELVEALAAAAGLDLDARAAPPGGDASEPLGPVVAGQRLDVHVLADRAAAPARVTQVRLRSRHGWPLPAPERPDHLLDAPLSLTLPLTVPADAEPTRPWFHRPDIRLNRYLVRDSSQIHLGESGPELEVVVRVDFGGEVIELVRPVRTIVSDPPRGSLLRPLTVVPPVSVSLSPAAAILRPESRSVELDVSVTTAAPLDAPVAVALELAPGWSASPTVARVRSGGTGRTETVRFAVSASSGASSASSALGPVAVRAVATVAGRRYAEGYETIEHPDLFPGRLYREALTTVRRVDVAMPAGRRVGYVMGVGDEVPGAIARLGATVTLLDAEAVRTDDLSTYDAVVVGTRAYAVRADLVAANDRFLDYARAGGNLVVLYQTPEYRPENQAPFPASLPGDAEEVSEEDATVTLLAPTHPLLTAPNRIGPADFEGWIEQRGSKFFATWDAAYTPLVEVHDTGQPEQRGVWLTARVGEGHFTYVALALHRQLPYGVPGAYRILANLLVGSSR